MALEQAAGQGQAVQTGLELMDEAGPGTRSCTWRTDNETHAEGRTLTVAKHSEKS